MSLLSQLQQNGIFGNIYITLVRSFIPCKASVIFYGSMEISWIINVQLLSLSQVAETIIDEEGSIIWSRFGKQLYTRFLTKYAS